MSDFVIETSHLQKVFGRKIAVEDLTLQVPRGEIFGFLGPNGAGKSTSVKMLLGLVRATQGSATVLGHAPGHAAAMRQIGFLPEHFRFHEWLQAHELLDVHGRLYGMDGNARRRRIPEVLELVGLSEHARRPIAGFSKGMLQRIGLAQALLHNPVLVFLDEPTSALDPFGRMLVRNIIHELKAQGTTVFLNSHLLGEVEATCDRVAFIKSGRVVQTMSMKDLQPDYVLADMQIAGATSELLISLEAVLGTAPQSLEPDSAIDRLTNNGSEPIWLRLTLPNSEMLPVVAEQTIAYGARLYALTPHHVSLEERFLDIIGREDSGQ